MLKILDLEVSFHLRYKSLEAIRRVSLEIQPHEMIGLVGESGSGKSTIAKALLKLLPETAEVNGQILFHGDDLLSYNNKQLRRVRGCEIGMIFQDPMSALNPTMRIGAQIAESYRRKFPREKSQQVKAQVLQLLQLVGIPEPEERITHYPHMLSGGMRQRALIAQALAAKPQLLIADEPTTALDVTIQVQVLKLLQEIREKTGTAILIITHDLSVVAGYCDRTLVMYAGKIIESGPTEELFARPLHPYTKKLLRAIPRIDAPENTPLYAIAGAPPDMSKLPKGCAFAPRCERATARCQIEDPLLINTTPHSAACWNL